MRKVKNKTLANYLIEYNGVRKIDISMKGVEMDIFDRIFWLACGAFAAYVIAMFYLILRSDVLYYLIQIFSNC